MYGTNHNESLNTDLTKIFAAIEASASGYPFEGDIKGLFADKALMLVVTMKVIANSKSRSYSHE